MKFTAISTVIVLLFMSCGTGNNTTNDSTPDTPKVITGETPPSCFEPLDNTKASIVGNWYSVGVVDGYVNNIACLPYDTAVKTYTNYMDLPEQGEFHETGMLEFKGRYVLRDNNRKFLVYKNGNDTNTYEIGRLDSQFLILMVPDDLRMNRPKKTSVLYMRK